MPNPQNLDAVQRATASLNRSQRAPARRLTARQQRAAAAALEPLTLQEFNSMTAPEALERELASRLSAAVDQTNEELHGTSATMLVIDEAGDVQEVPQRERLVEQLTEPLAEVSRAVDAELDTQAGFRMTSGRKLRGLPEGFELKIAGWWATPTGGTLADARLRFAHGVDDRPGVIKFYSQKMPNGMWDCETLEGDTIVQRSRWRMCVRAAIIALANHATAEA